MSDQPEHSLSCDRNQGVCAPWCPLLPMHDEDHVCTDRCLVPCPLDDEDPRGWQG